MVDISAKRGNKAVAITDHGNMYGTLQFYTECLTKNIKPILGEEFYVCDDITIKSGKPQLNHLVLLAKNEIGYKIPPMTPFIGRNFNVTKAGIHADGLLKDEEIYNIFDTDKILNRPAAVMISKTSGLAGIAYWINQNYGLKGDKVIGKRDELVLKLKEWIDKEYEDGRQTALSNDELEEKINELTNGKGVA